MKRKPVRIAAGLMLVSIVLARGLWPVAAIGEEKEETGKVAPLPAGKAVNGILRADIWWSLHKQYSARAAKGNLDLIFVGDSITFLWGKTGQKVWDKYYGSRKAAHFGISADRSENVLWRVQNGKLEASGAKCFVLLIGTNDSMTKPAKEGKATADVVANIVQALRQKCPKAHVIVMSIFPKRARGNAEWMNEQVAAANAEIAKLDDGKFVHVRDISKELLDKDGKADAALVPDGVHPSEAGYEKWAAAIENDIKGILGGPAAEPGKDAEKKASP